MKKGTPTMKNDIHSLLRDDFLSFARKALRELDGTILSEDRYLDYLASKLTAFADDEIKRLIVNAPPRHLKSQLGTVCLTAWILGHHPNKKIIVLAGSARLAEKLARPIRAILQAKWYRNIFPTRIKKGHGEATNFATVDGGEVFAASIHANITGRGGDIIILDDPHDTNDAGNPHQLAKAIGRFNKNVKSRLNNHRTGRFLVIAHRVSEADLSAHLLARGGWQHVVLPFLATRDETYKTDCGIWRRRKGELLRADDADDEHIAELKQTEPNFDMLYQQDCDGQARLPIMAELFPIFAPDTIAHLPRVLSIDPGATDGDDASFSVIQVWAFDAKNYYLLDDYRAQCEFEDLKRKARHLRKLHRAYAILIENTANGPGLISQLKRKLKARCLIVPITPRGSKTARLNRHIDKIRQGRVQLAADAAYWVEFTDEIVVFPYGKHDDQVDAFTQMADFVDQHGALAKPPQRMTPDIPMVVSGNSQGSGWGHRSLPTAKPGERGICIARGNSHYAPNGPFIQAKAWVVK
jgi:predicted phage terminase large subunit-like protein